MFSNKQLSLSFLLVIAIGFTGWLILHHKQSSYLAHKNANNPDSIADEVTIITMDVEGKPASKISAKQLIHFPDNNTSLASSPKLTVFIKNEQPWHITANKGKSVDGDNMIQLWDDVQFMQPADQDSPQSLILTESFTFWPKKHLGETDKPITLLQPGTKVTAVGLNADTLSGKIDLLKDVRGSYVAQN